MATEGFVTTTTNKKVLKKLEKTTYKFSTIVEDLLESKIRWLCDKFPHNEWSGILFYRTEGKLSDGTLKVFCHDMHLMDYGSATFTEYMEDPSIIAYMDDHDLLVDYNIGIIHSHNTMAAFFSGTDQNTLKQEGNDKDNFFSLIINNAGKYVSGITVKMHDDIPATKNIYSFTDFDGSTSIYKEVPYEYSDWFVDWSEGDITIEVPTKEVDFTERINEIKEKKDEEEKARRAKYSTSYFGNSSLGNPWSKDYSVPSSGYGPLFDGASYTSHSNWLNNRSTAQNDKNVVSETDEYEDMFLQLLTLSIFTNHNSKLNLRTYIRFMPTMIKRRFKSLSDYYNSLELFSDMVFDDPSRDYQKAAEYCINRCNEFKSCSNEAFELFRQFLETFLFNVETDPDLAPIEGSRSFFDDMEKDEDPYHWGR